MSDDETSGSEDEWEEEIFEDRGEDSFRAKVTDLFNSRSLLFKPAVSGACDLPAYPMLTISPDPGATEDDQFLITLPFIERELAALSSHIPSLAPSNDQDATYSIDVTRVHFAQPDWDSALQALVRTSAQNIGIKEVDNVVAVPSRLLVCRSGRTSEPMKLEFPNPGFGTLIVQLASVFEGGGIEVQCEDGRAQMGESHERYSKHHYTVFQSRFPCTIEPLTSGARLLMVYSLCWTGEDPLPMNLLLEPKSAFEEVARCYAGETVVLQFDDHYLNFPCPMEGEDWDFIEHLNLAQNDHNPPQGQRFEQLIVTYQDCREYRQDGYHWDKSNSYKIVTAYNIEWEQVPFLPKYKFPRVHRNLAEYVGEFRTKFKTYSSAFLYITRYLSVPARKLEVLEGDQDRLFEWAHEEMKNNIPEEKWEAFFHDLMTCAAPQKGSEAEETMVSLVVWLGEHDPSFLRRCLRYRPRCIARNLHLFDFWGNEEDRAAIAELLKINPDSFGQEDPVDIECLFEAITPLNPGPDREQSLQAWAEEACQSITKVADKLSTVHGGAIARICLRTAQPERHLQAYIVAAFSKRGFEYSANEKSLSRLEPFDRGVLDVPEWSGRYLPVRNFLFEYTAQIINQHKLCSLLPPTDVVYFLCQSVALLHGRQLASGVMEQFLDPSIPSEDRMQVIEDCCHLSLPRMSAVCAVELKIQQELHRRYRAVPYRTTASNTVEPQPGKITAQYVRDFLLGPESECLLSHEQAEQLYDLFVPLNFEPNFDYQDTGVKVTKPAIDYVEYRRVEIQTTAMNIGRLRRISALCVRE